MPSTETLNYLAAVLKFSSVPAAAFELIISESHRNCIESWLFEELPKLLRCFGIIVLVLYICVFLLAKAGPFLILITIAFHNLIVFLIALVMGLDKPVGSCAVGFTIFFGTLVLAIFEKWILPESWVLAIAYPFEAFSVWANGNPYVDWVLPDYSGKGFLDSFRQVFLAVENWLWNWLASLYRIYFFLARGLMLLVVVLIQILFFLSVILSLPLTLGLLLYLLIKFSDSAKRTLQIPKGRIPAGAFVLWAIGESLEFGLKTLEQFQKDG